MSLPAGFSFRRPNKLHEDDEIGLQTMAATDSNSSISDEETYLHFARAYVLNNDKSALKKLGAGDPRILNATDNLGRSLLIYASSSNKVKIVKFLLKRGSNVDTADSLSRTPLHWAVHWGHGDVVKLLLQHSANVKLADADGSTPLHLAVKQPSAKCLKILLDFVEKRGCFSLNKFLDAKQRSLLHWAATLGHPEHLLLLFRTILIHEVDQPDDEGNTPLLLAASSALQGSLICCQLLTQQAPWTARAQDKMGNSVLHLAASANNAEAIDFLLTSRLCRSDQFDDAHRTPLHAACISGALDAVDALLRGGACVTATDFRYATPLHYAASLSSTVCVQLIRLLLTTENAGKNCVVDAEKTTSSKFDGIRDEKVVRIISGRKGVSGDELTGDGDTPRSTSASRDADGRTPLACAVAIGADDAVRTFFELTAVNKAQKDHNGYSLLHIAAQAGQLQTLQILIKEEFALEALEVYGLSPLLTAVESGQTRCVQALLKAGADAARCDRQGRTALHWAALGGHAFLCQFLVKQGLNPDFSDLGGRTPLHCAAFVGSVDCVSILLHACPQTIWSTDHHGYVPLHLAVEQGHVTVVKLLIQSEDSFAVNAVCHSDDDVADSACRRPFTPLDLALDRLRRQSCPAFDHDVTESKSSGHRRSPHPDRSTPNNDVIENSSPGHLGVLNCRRLPRQLPLALSGRGVDIDDADFVTGRIERDSSDVIGEDPLVDYLRTVGALTYADLSDAAATKIQAFYRAYAVRKAMARCGRWRCGR